MKQFLLSKFGNVRRNEALKPVTIANWNTGKFKVDCKGLVNNIRLFNNRSVLSALIIFSVFL